MYLSPANKSLSALADLLDCPVIKEWYYAERAKGTLLKSHPFSFETNLPYIHRNEDIFIVGDIGHCDGSVVGMKAMLIHQLTMLKPQCRSEFRLRITRVQRGVNFKDPTKQIHDLFFELISFMGTAICGGCNDYSGAGGATGKELERIFNFIGAICDIPVEEKIYIVKDETKYQNFRRGISTDETI